MKPAKAAWSRIGDNGEAVAIEEIKVWSPRSEDDLIVEIKRPDENGGTWSLQIQLVDAIGLAEEILTASRKCIVDKY